MPKLVRVAHFLSTGFVPFLRRNLSPIASSYLEAWIKAYGGLMSLEPPWLFYAFGVLILTLVCVLGN